MTNISRVITDLGEVGKDLDTLVRDFPEIAESSMLGALVNGGFLGDVVVRTPRSQLKKYQPAQPGIRNGNPGWANERYGTGRLIKSLVPGGGTPNDLKVTKTSQSISFTIGSNVDYAPKMHETMTPDEGETWTGERYGKGWSTQKTGNRYLEMSYDDNRQSTLGEFLRNVEAQFRQRGII